MAPVLIRKIDVVTGEIVDVEEDTELPEIELPAPSEISDRQFFQQCAILGLINEVEALAAVSTGTLPAAMAAFVETLPSEEQFAARMTIQGATVFHRDHPLVPAFGTAWQMDDAALDALWRAASVL